MHGKDSSIEKQTFVSFDDFLVWKKLTEQESNSWFVQHRQQRMCKGNETYCFIAIILVTCKGWKNVQEL